MKNPLEAFVGFHLVRTGNLGLKALNSSYGDLPVRHPDVAVAMVIHANPGITQSSIGKMLSIQRSNMVPIIARLEQRGWVERRAGKGKTIGLFISPDGEKVMPALQAASQSAEDFIAAKIGAEAFEQLRAILKKIS